MIRSSIGSDNCPGLFDVEDVEGSESCASPRELRDHGWGYYHLLRQDWHSHQEPDDRNEGSLVYFLSLC